MSIRKAILTGAAAFAAVTSPALAQDAGSSLSDHVLYGVNRDTGELLRYDFADAELGAIGPVQWKRTTYTGVDAMAYVPGFGKFFAFWTDPATRQTQLLYVHVDTADAYPMFDLEGGRMTGATVVQQADGSYITYGTQAAKVTPPFTVAGGVNLNPSNSSNNEFELFNAANGYRLNRDNLHRDAHIRDDGTIYEGVATMVKFRPKGNGGQNGLTINGEDYDLRNSNTYMLQGNMTVRIYNDKPQSGKAMGLWWLQISGEAYWGDDVAVETPDRLVTVDHKTGILTEIMPTQRAYDGLATLDNGASFYATQGDKLYRIVPDPLTGGGTESLVASVPGSAYTGLEALGSVLSGFDMTFDRLVRANPETGEWIGSAVMTGAYNLGSIVYVPRAEDPALEPDAFD